MSESSATGDTKDSLGEVFARHRAPVRAVLRRLGVAEQNLDDALQDVFVVLVRRIEDYEPSGSMRAWLNGIARRVAGDYRRSAGRRRRLLGAVPPADGVPDPEELAARSEAARILEGFLARLGKDRCEVYLLSEVHGLTGPEIARKLGVNLNTVYGRLRDARRELDRAVEHVRARDARSVGMLIPVVPRLALGAASGSAMVLLPAILLFLSAIGNLYVLWSEPTAPQPSSGSSSGACPPGVPPSPEPASSPGCIQRRERCTARVRDCRAKLIECDETQLRDLPWPMRFDEEAPNPAAELALQPILDRHFRSQEGVEVDVECRGPLCRLTTTMLDSAFRRIDSGGSTSPSEQLQADDWYRENIQGAGFEAGLPTTDLVSGEGLWLSTTWLYWNEEKVP